jgi:hypothetical protein
VHRDVWFGAKTAVVDHRRKVTPSLRRLIAGRSTASRGSPTSEREGREPLAVQVQKDGADTAGVDGVSPAAVNPASGG